MTVIDREQHIEMSKGGKAALDRTLRGGRPSGRMCLVHACPGSPQIPNLFSQYLAPPSVSHSYTRAVA